MAEIEFDLTPYINEAMARFNTMVDERLKEHFREAFLAGKARGRDEGAYEYAAFDMEGTPDFEEWFTEYVERLKRDE